MVHTENHKLVNFFIYNRPKPSSFGIFLAAVWNEASGKGGLGFIIIDTNAKTF